MSQANLLDDTRKCPFCAEEIKIEAVVCKHCKHEIGTIEKVGNDNSKAEFNIGIFVAGGAVIGAIILAIFEAVGDAGRGIGAGAMIIPAAMGAILGSVVGYIIGFIAKKNR